MATVTKAPKQTCITATTPRIKIEVTAWARTGQEKRWQLNKPVTVIGSKRHAQVIVRKDDVNRAHAVIVNSGTDVLLVDLLSDTGTYCNGRLVKKKLLKDGDVLRVGSTEMRVAIELPPKPVVPRRGMLAFDDPFTMPKAMRLLQVDTDERWDITDSVAIIGSRRNAQVFLEEEEIALAHSLIFATIYGIGILDLGSSTPLKVNGKERKMTYLKHQDRLLIGKVGLMVQFPMADDGSGSGSHGPALEGDQECFAQGESTSLGGATAAIAQTQDELLRFEQEVDMGSGAAAMDSDGANVEPGAELLSLGGKISALQEELAESWGRINEWKKKLTLERNNLTVREQDLQNNEKKLSLLVEEVEHRAQQLADQQRQCEKEQSSIAARDAELDQVRAGLDNQDAELKARRAELMALAGELETRHKEVERFAAEYETQCKEIESQRKELELQEAAIDDHRSTVERERQSVKELADELESESRKLADREDELSSREAKTQEQGEALQAAKQQFEWQREQLSLRKSELADYEDKLKARYDELVEREQQVHQRSEVISRFRQFLEEANEAYDITINTPVDPAANTIPEMSTSQQPSSNKPTADGAAFLKHARRERQSTVQELQDETGRMVKELHAEPPVEEEVRAGQPAANGVSTAEDHQAGEEMLDVSALEPEVRERFRALKRLGSNDRSDADMIEQIRADLEAGKSKPPKGRKKMTWWKG